MKAQSEELLIEWNARVGSMLNASYVLKSEKSTLIEEKKDGETYSRVHRMTNGTLILEERAYGSMYPRVWEMIQDFSEMEALFQQKQGA